MFEKQFFERQKSYGIVTICIMAFFISCAGFWGCASQEENMIKEERLRAKAAQEVKREMGPVEEMRLTIQADEKLNWHDNAPHPLVLCVYQLSSPGSFADRQQGKKGISELLACKSFDSSVLSHQRFTIQPARKIARTIYRMEGAKYLGIAAGYFSSSGGETSGLITFDNTAVKVTLGRGSLNINKTGKSKGF